MRNGGVDAGEVITILESLGGPPSGGKYRCPAPDHDDANPSCSIFRRSDGRTGWKCWSCRAAGDLIDLQVLLGKNKKDALAEAGLITPDDDDWKKGKGKKQKKTSKSQRGKASHAPPGEYPPVDQWPDSWGPDGEGGMLPPLESLSEQPTKQTAPKRQPSARQARSGARSTQAAPAGKNGGNGQSDSQEAVESVLGPIPPEVDKEKPGRSPSARRAAEMSRTSQPAKVKPRQKAPEPGVVIPLAQRGIAESSWAAERRKRNSNSPRSPQGVDPKGVLLRSPDADFDPRLLSTPGKAVADADRRLFDDWADPWPLQMLEAEGVGPARRKVKVDGGFDDLPVGRVPARDCHGDLAGWTDRVLVTSDGRRWLYAKGIAVRCVGAHLLKGWEDLGEPCEEIWLVEGHSDWLTCLAMLKHYLGLDFPVLGAHASQSMPLVAAVLAAQKRAERLVIIADSDKAGVEAAARAAKSWLRHAETKPAIALPKKRKADLTDVLRWTDYDHLIKSVMHAVRVSNQTGEPSVMRV